jgi:hypothetical protein
MPARSNKKSCDAWSTAFYWLQIHIFFFQIKVVPHVFTVVFPAGFIQCAEQNYADKRGHQQKNKDWNDETPHLEALPSAFCISKVR